MARGFLRCSSLTFIHQEAMIQCSLEACRILDTLGLLQQEVVSRKRKAKNWEDEDFYDSDDDTFLDRTGLVEKKRLNRMKKAGKVDEKPETFESLASFSYRSSCGRIINSVLFVFVF